MKHWFDVLSALKFFFVCIDSHIFEHLIQHISRIFKNLWMEVHLYIVYFPLNRALLSQDNCLYSLWCKKKKQKKWRRILFTVNQHCYKLQVYVTRISVQEIKCLPWKSCYRSYKSCLNPPFSGESETTVLDRKTYETTNVCPVCGISLNEKVLCGWLLPFLDPITHIIRKLLGLWALHG